MRGVISYDGMAISHTHGDCHENFSIPNLQGEAVASAIDALLQFAPGDAPSQTGLTLAKYMMVMFKLSNADKLVMVNAYIYLHRLTQLHSTLEVSSSNREQLALTALMLAHKFVTDEGIHNKDWVTMSGNCISLFDLNTMEATVLQLLGYCLFVTRDEYMDCGQHLMIHFTPQTRFAFAPTAGAGGLHEASAQPVVVAQTGGLNEGNENHEIITKKGLKRSKNAPSGNKKGDQLVFKKFLDSYPRQGLIVVDETDHYRGQSAPLPTTEPSIYARGLVRKVTNQTMMRHSATLPVAAPTLAAVDQPSEDDDDPVARASFSPQIVANGRVPDDAGQLAFAPTLAEADLQEAPASNPVTHETESTLEDIYAEVDQWFCDSEQKS